MIINSLFAENVLKYADLQMRSLPSEGLIAISGLNESGKSTIGETICFALFGRTYSIDPEHIAKVIRWGETRCSTTIEFTLSNGKRYRLDRFLDDKGDQGARLMAADQKEPIARNVDEVELTVKVLIGFGYPEFIESFYLAQREITTPHPQSVTVKTMAGVASLEQVAKVLTEEVAQHRRIVNETEHKITKLSAQLSRLGVREGRLGELEEQRRLAEEEKLQKEDVAEKLRDASQACQKSVPTVRGFCVQIDDTHRARNIAHVISLSFWLLAVAAWVVLLVMRLLSAGEASEGMRDPWLFGSALATSLIFVVFWIRSQWLRFRLARLERGAIAQAETAEATRGDLGEQEDRKDVDGPLLSTERFRQHRGRMLELAQEYANRIAVLREDIARYQARLKRDNTTLTDRLESLDEDILKERARCKEAAELESQAGELWTKIEERKRRLMVHERALELLAGACRDISQRFNRAVGSLAGTLLPSLTDNRYEHLEIDESFDVRLFSNEKRDFMDLDEISSGTQRQVMLGLRLALSQALIRTAIGGSQFIFLDEPFAFFDAQRMRGALAAVRILSVDIPQIFIIAQEFPEGSTLDKHIVCKREAQDIFVDAASDIKVSEA